MSSLDYLYDRILQLWPTATWGRSPIIIASSGGADSVALFRLLLAIKNQFELRNPLVITHVNHGQRGIDSDLDEQFVKTLAVQHNVEMRSSRLDVPYPASEETLRKARYGFFQQIAAEFGARYVATGHHCDDQIETFLFRLFRGTSLVGATGVQVTRELAPGVSLIRPLLTSWRFELLEYLTSINQPFRIDSSNDQNVYSRNFLRNELLPSIEQRFGERCRFRLADFQNELGELNDFVQKAVCELEERGVRYECDTVFFSISAAHLAASIVLRSLFVKIWEQMNWSRGPMTRSHWNQVLQLVQTAEQRTDQKNQQLMLPSGIVATKSQDQILFVKRHSI